MWESRDPILEFWDTTNTSQTVEAKNSKFGTEIDGGELWREKCKIGWRGSCGGHVTQFWNFGTNLISREELKLKTTNLARRRTSVSSNEINAKLGQKGPCGGNVTQCWYFGTSLIPRERLKPETSNLAGRLTAVSSNEKQCNIWSKDFRKGVHVTQFWNFRTPYISRTVEDKNFKFSTETDGGEL